MDEPINKATRPNSNDKKKSVVKKQISREEVGRKGLGVGFPIGGQLRELTA